MALANYTDLVAAVKKWLEQDDIAASVPDLIRLAEARMNRELSVEDMVTTAVYTFTTNGPYALPADLVGTRVLRVDRASGGGTVLEWRSPDTFWPTVAQTTSGQPVMWCREGDNFYIAPSPDSSLSGTLAYLQEIPALRSSAPVNWLLTKAPDLYLYGALLEAAPYLYDDKRIATWSALFDRGKQSLMSSDARARYRPASRRRAY